MWPASRAASASTSVATTSESSAPSAVAPGMGSIAAWSRAAPSTLIAGLRGLAFAGFAGAGLRGLAFAGFAGAGLRFSVGVAFAVALGLALAFAFAVGLDARVGFARFGARFADFFA